MMAAGRAVASPGTELVPLTASRGFPYIATRAEAQVGGAVVLEMLAEAHHTVDAAIVAAFGDPGLLGARELFDIPVVGVSEAAMLTACMLGQRFAIVTFTRALCPWFRDCVDLHGLAGRCAGIVALEGPVPSIDAVQDQNEQRLVALAQETVRASGADVLIFAGAPLAGLAAKVVDRLPIPIVDPVAAAVKQAELLVALNPRKAVGGGFARPGPKSSIGLPAPLTDRMSHADAQS
ncbi:aspartate/glutamate racemase family protein [Hyphomicrobiales bacterium BP6-180914]|uniref:Aspartate/glutamate racemase family protein n=2 Tax=Lichenifustis flavocetrariae TaxID=2949735 RepID=A0AA42CKI2_9HYPH|nr:aspartate/glutamate racemase family protein [Lichenifustis flavocetrariae]